MSQTRFIAVLPQTIQPGDKILVKGKVSDNAEQFSINFVNDRCKNPDNITYHFKWILTDDIIVEDYKQNGNWMDYRESVYDALDGRFANSLKIANLSNDSIGNGFKFAHKSAPTSDNEPYINSYSILGPTFALEFAFQDDGIYVYLIYEDGRNLITHYEPQNDLSEIESLQVWGDVEKIKELTFSYN